MIENKQKKVYTDYILPFYGEKHENFQKNYIYNMLGMSVAFVHRMWGFRAQNTRIF